MINENLNQFVKVAAGSGITTGEMLDNVKRIKHAVPALSEADIILLKNNPSLNWLTKRKLIKIIRKEIQYNKNE